MFPNRLKELRKANGLTQDQLAEVFNMSTRAISTWETGERSPTIEMLVRLADYFDVSTDYLLGRTVVENWNGADGTPIVMASSKPSRTPELRAAREERIRELSEDQSVSTALVVGDLDLKELRSLVERMVDERLEERKSIAGKPEIDE